MWVRMKEWFERYKTILGVFGVPNVAMLCSAKFRGDDDVWSEIEICDDQSSMSAFIRKQYQQRPALIAAAREAIAEEGQPKLTDDEMEKCSLPLTRLSDIGPKAWVYLKAAAQRDVDKFYTAEVFNILAWTKADQDDDKKCITETMLGSVSQYMYHYVICDDIVET